MPATAIGTHVVWMSTCAMALSPEGAFQNDTRRLQAAHTFLMSELHCQSCCKEEWRSCLCILGCDVFQGQCDGVDAVESCDVLRRCYERVDELSPKGFDFVFQCKLMKCIAFCMNQEQVCAPIRNSFVAARFGQKAAHILQRMRSAGPSPDLMSFSSMVTAFSRGQHLARALHFVAQTQEEGWSSDLVPFSALIGACAAHARWEEAVQGLGRLSVEASAPLAARLAAISACARARRWQLALALRGADKDVRLFGAAVHAADCGRNWQLALGLKQEMSSEHLAVNTVAMNSVLSCLAKAGRWQLVLCLLEDMPKEDPRSSPLTRPSQPASAAGTGRRPCSSSPRCGRRPGEDQRSERERIAQRLREGPQVAGGSGAAAAERPTATAAYAGLLQRSGQRLREEPAVAPGPAAHAPGASSARAGSHCHGRVHQCLREGARMGARAAACFQGAA
ncbi:unnamed protein product [Effrenium voratum]|nr:unnamed protein product [Effrenium voratum]